MSNTTEDGGSVRMKRIGCTNNDQHLYSLRQISLKNAFEYMTYGTSDMTQTANAGFWIVQNWLKWHIELQRCAHVTRSIGRCIVAEAVTMDADGNVAGTYVSQHGNDRCCYTFEQQTDRTTHVLNEVKPKIYSASCHNN